MGYSHALKSGHFQRILPINKTNPFSEKFSPAENLFKNWRDVISEEEK